MFHYLHLNHYLDLWFAIFPLILASHLIHYCLGRLCTEACLEVSGPSSGSQIKEGLWKTNPQNLCLGPSLMLPIPVRNVEWLGETGEAGPHNCQCRPLHGAPYDLRISHPDKHPRARVQAWKIKMAKNKCNCSHKNVSIISMLVDVSRLRKNLKECRSREWGTCIWEVVSKL